MLTYPCRLDVGTPCVQVLAFPTMQFKQQEEKDANTMCQIYKKLDVNFPVFETIDINGPNSHPIFQYCKVHCKDVRSDS